MMTIIGCGESTKPTHRRCAMEQRRASNMDRVSSSCQELMLCLKCRLIKKNGREKDFEFLKIEPNFYLLYSDILPTDMALFYYVVDLIRREQGTENQTTVWGWRIPEGIIRVHCCHTEPRMSFSSSSYSGVQAGYCLESPPPGGGPRKTGEKVGIIQNIDNPQTDHQP